MLTLISSRFSFWFSVVGIIITAVLLIRTSISEGIPDPLVDPPPKPVTSKLAGSGIVESFGDNIRVSSFVPGVVSDVLVNIGESVNEGDPLFVLDSRIAESELAIAKSSLAVAEANLDSLEKTLDRLTAVRDSRAVSEAELEARRSEVEVAQAQIGSATTKVKQAETAISLLTVKSPSDGAVLQVNIRGGEFTAPGSMPPPVLLGNRDDLQVRVDIDEEFVGKIPEKPAGRGFVRGFDEKGYELEFVRVEPLVVPKRNLSALPSERVDTRVLQIIFKLKDPRARNHLYIGQQLDVYIYPES